MKNIQFFPVHIFVLVFIYSNQGISTSVLSKDLLSKLREAENLQQLVSKMDFKDTDLKDVMRLLAKQYGLNIFVDDDVDKRLTLHLVNLSLAEVLNFIIEETHLILQESGSVYKISNPAQNDSCSLQKSQLKINFRDGLLSVDFQNEDIREVFYQISKITDHTILLDRNVSGPISSLIINLPLDKALYFLAKNCGCYLIQEGLVYQIKKGRFETHEQEEINSRNFFLIVHENLIDIEVNKIELTNILTELFQQLGTNFFLIDEIKGTVTAIAQNLTLAECLNILLSSYEYAYKKVNGHYLLGSKNNKLLLNSHLIPVKYLKVDSILEMLPEKLIEKIDYKIIKEHNALLIYAANDQITEIELTVRNLDKPVPQILIEALVVDYSYQNIKEISFEGGLDGTVDTTRGSGDKWFSALDVFLTGRNVNKYLKKVEGYFGVSNIGKLPEDFYLKLKALETIGKANIRSKPQIATLNGYPADITIGQTQYYILTTQTPIRDPSQVYIQETQQFHTIEANITLKITPWVSASGEITVDIHPEFNNPVGQFSSEIPPTIQRRALNSTVRLRDGETIVLGGLIQTIESVNKFQLPILGRIPVIGNLFKSTNHQQIKSELIIYITPHLSYSENLIGEG